MLFTPLKSNDEKYGELLAEKLYRVGDADCSVHVDDPEGFIEIVLEATLTDAPRNICKSVTKYPITIAQSGNGTGKSWISTRLALWCYGSSNAERNHRSTAPQRHPKQTLKTFYGPK